MEKLKQILTGVSDYGEFRRSNGYFVDRTDLIAELDLTRFALFLRPRRFGKSLWTSILRAYYDIRRKDQFDYFFKGTKIGADRNLATLWHLKPNGPISLIRLSVVLHGPELALAEVV